MGYRVSDEAMEAPLWALLQVAETAAAMYDRAENPSRYGDGGTMAALAEWFPKLGEALKNAGMLK